LNFLSKKKKFLVFCFFLKKKFKPFNLVVSLKKLLFFFFLRLKYILEKMFSTLLNCFVVVFFSLTNHTTFFLKKNKKLKYHRYLQIPYSIKKLQKIQNQLFLNFLDSFYFCNAQVLVDEIAVGLNRVRNQRSFFRWLVRQLQFFFRINFTIHSLRFIICGKINAGTRTKFQVYQFGESGIRSQTFALKIDYGYSSAETFTGTFGLHLWIYRKDKVYLGKITEQTRPLLTV